MGYSFNPVNADIGNFHMSFLWSHFLEQCGSYFISVHRNGKFFFISGVDERMPEKDAYPRIISNDGFHVTEEEAKVLSRIAWNYATIQRHLEDQPEHDINLPCYKQPWPVKIREDWVDQLEKFAEWAEKSGGFDIR